MGSEMCIRDRVEDIYAHYPAVANDSSPQVNGDKTQRVLRGGSWNYPPQFLRAASRNSYTTDYRFNSHGFRLAKTLG